MILRYTIMSGVGSMILPLGSFIKVSTELPVATRHRRDMPEKNVEGNVEPEQTNTHDMSQLMRLWYLSHRRPAKAQASLRILAVSPEPSLFAHMKYGSRRKGRPKSDM